MIWVALAVARPGLHVGTAILNAAVVPRLRPVSRFASTPLVSVLVPARNEAQVIGSAVRALLQQTHPSFEVLILDDHSTDGTADVVAREAADDPAYASCLGQICHPAGWARTGLASNWPNKALVTSWSLQTPMCTGLPTVWRHWSP